MSIREKTGRWLYENRIASAICLLLILGVTVLVPGLGTLFAFAITGCLLWLKANEGVIGETGFRRPDCWARTVIVAFILGTAIELSYQVLFNPLLEKITGSPLDLGPFDQIRGNASALLFSLFLGWFVGGFLEEMTFRGYLITRLKKLLGGSPVSVFIAILISAAAFGLAHLYQGISGVLSTGSIGLILGIVFVLNGYNLWLLIFTHGFINTVGMMLIYFSLDHDLGNLLF